VCLVRDDPQSMQAPMQAPAGRTLSQTSRQVSQYYGKYYCQCHCTPGWHTPCWHTVCCIVLLLHHHPPHLPHTWPPQPSSPHTQRPGSLGAAPPARRTTPRSRRRRHRCAHPAAALLRSLHAQRRARLGPDACSMQVCAHGWLGIHTHCGVATLQAVCDHAVQRSTCCLPACTMLP
jgi:hypothetical protein